MYITKLLANKCLDILDSNMKDYISYLNKLCLRIKVKVNNIYILFVIHVKIFLLKYILYIILIRKTE